MSYTQILFLFFSLSTTLQLKAEHRTITNLFINHHDSLPSKSFWQKDAVKITFTPTMFFGATAITWSNKQHIKEARDQYIPNFKNKYDDYLQYIPAALTFGLKSAGIKGRNNLKRSTITYATTMGFTALFVNSLKHTTKIMRPDNSSANSWPSGHSAIAFANAGFLDREYGIVNHAYPIIGYTLATATGLGRNLNNRHWVPDVLAGAGFGLLSNHLAYFFIDKIYGNKGDNLSLISNIEGNENPSFLSAKLGFLIAHNQILMSRHGMPKAKIGWEGGLEGAYFFNKHLGVGADIILASFPLQKNETLTIEQQNILDDFKLKVNTISIGTLNFGVGPFYAIHLSDKWNIMFKSLLGFSFGAKGAIELQRTEESPNMPTAINDKILVATYKPHSTFRSVSGAILTFNFTDELGISLFGDYTYSSPDLKYTFDTTFLENGSYKTFITKKDISYISVGLKLTAYF